MNHRVLMEMFSEGQVFDIVIPCQLTIMDKNVDNEDVGDNYLNVEIDIDPTWYSKMEKVDSSFIDDLRISVGSGCYPEALLEMIPKEKAKVKTRYKKELQAKIKAMQEELDSL